MRLPEIGAHAVKVGHAGRGLEPKITIGGDDQFHWSLDMRANPGANCGSSSVVRS